MWVCMMCACGGVWVCVMCACDGVGGVANENCL